MPTVAELLIESLAEYGVTTVWGVVGDALNPVTDAIRREERIEWIGVRHEEAGAFAASAQAQLTGKLAVCMGTVGPGAIHLLNGLYDAKKSHAPVLAICGQVPREDMGTEFFQEVDNDAAVQGRVGVQPDGHPPRPAADADRAGRQRRDPGLRGRGADPARRRRRPRPAQGHGGAPVRADAAARDAGARRRAAGGVVAQRGRQGDPARRPGRARGPRRGAAARRAPGRADGAHPQGEGGAGAGQRLRGRPVRTARQPRDREGVRGLRRAVPRRHRLPLPGLPALRQDRDPARRPRVAHRPADARRPGPRRRRGPGTAGAAPAAGAEDRPRPSRRRPVDVREVAGAAGGVHRPGVRREAEGSAATQGRQPRLADPPRAAGGGPRPARGAGRDLHHRHRDGHGLALPVRPDDRPASPDRLVQPRLDGERDAAGPRRECARPETARWSRSAATAGCPC